MEMSTGIKLSLLCAIVGVFAGAALMRLHLNAAHKADQIRSDRACLSSVFQAAQIAKRHKKRVPRPVLVSEGTTR